MTEAYSNFEKSIKDSESLLEIFDDPKIDLSSDSQEAIKRSALVMICVAWETYIEDLITEIISKKIEVISGSQVGRYIQSSLNQRIKLLHNPNSHKVKQLFEEFLEVDLTTHWVWNNYDADRVRTSLNQWLNLRGDAVHRARNCDENKSLVKRDELSKCIRFFKDLVRTTDDVVSKI